MAFQDFDEVQSAVNLINKALVPSAWINTTLDITTDLAETYKNAITVKAFPEYTDFYVSINRNGDNVWTWEKIGTTAGGGNSGFKPMGEIVIDDLNILETLYNTDGGDASDDPSDPNLGNGDDDIGKFWVVTEITDDVVSDTDLPQNERDVDLINAGTDIPVGKETIPASLGDWLYWTGTHFVTIINVQLAGYTKTQIDSMISDLETVDSSIITKLDTEISDRTAADDSQSTAFETSISVLESTHVVDVNSLESKQESEIASEAVLRSSADVSLAIKISVVESDLEVVDSSLESDLSNLSTSISEQDNKISNNSESLASIELSVGSNETAISVLGSQHIDQSTSLSAISLVTSGNISDINSIESVISDLGEGEESLESLISENTASLSSLESLESASTSSMETRLSTNESDISSIDVEVSGLDFEKEILSIDISTEQFGQDTSISSIAVEVSGLDFENESLSTALSDEQDEQNSSISSIDVEISGLDFENESLSTALSDEQEVQDSSISEISLTLSTTEVHINNSITNISLKQTSISSAASSEINSLSVEVSEVERNLTASIEEVSNLQINISSAASSEMVSLETSIRSDVSVADSTQDVSIDSLETAISTLQVEVSDVDSDTIPSIITGISVNTSAISSLDSLHESEVSVINSTLETKLAISVFEDFLTPQHSYPSVEDGTLTLPMIIDDEIADLLGGTGALITRDSAGNTISIAAPTPATGEKKILAFEDGDEVPKWIDIPSADPFITELEVTDAVGDPVEILDLDDPNNEIEDETVKMLIFTKRADDSAFAGELNGYFELTIVKLSSNTFEMTISNVLGNDDFDVTINDVDKKVYLTVTDSNDDSSLLDESQFEVIKMQITKF